MLNGIFGVLLVLLLLLLVYWIAHTLASKTGAPGLLLTVFDIVLVLIFVAYVFYAFGLGGKIAGQTIGLACPSPQPEVSCRA